MPENTDCPSCNDLPGTPVPGQEDVYAFAMPMPPDDQLTPWHALQPSAKLHAAARGTQGTNPATQGTIPAAQTSWPEGLFDIEAAPEPGAATAAQPRIEYLPPLDAPGHPWPVQQQVQQPDPTAGVIQNPHDPSVTYLPPLGVPRFLAQEGHGEQEQDEPLELPEDWKEEQPKKPTDEVTEHGPYAGAPSAPKDYPNSPYKEDDHREIKLRPKKDDGPKVKLPGQDDFSDFDDDWKQSDAWLPDGPVFLRCPTEVTHKVVIWWIDSSTVGTVMSRQAAEKLANGAMESHSASDVLAKSLKEDVPRQQLDRFLDKRGWTCARECTREIEITGYFYLVQTMTAIYESILDGNDAYNVDLYIVHRLYAWVKIRCIQ